jgi:hypothetical protein
VGAVHLSDIAVQPPRWPGRPSIFQLCAEIGETLGANCRYPRRFVSKDGWQASAQKHPHLSTSLSQWWSFHCAVARGSHARSRHRAPASVPRPHCELADNGSTPPVTVGVSADGYRATAAAAYPAPPTRKHTHGAHCWRGCGFPWNFVALLGEVRHTL